MPTCGAQPVGLGSIRSAPPAVRLPPKTSIISSQSVPSIGGPTQVYEAAQGLGVWTTKAAGPNAKGGNIPESRSSDLATFVLDASRSFVPAWEEAVLVPANQGLRPMSRQNSGAGVGGISRSRESSATTLRNA